MGNNQSNHLLGVVRNWKELISKRTQIPGNPSLVQDERSFVLADCYEIPLHHNLDYQLKMMINHKNIDDSNIIKLIDAKIKEKTILECGTIDVVQVFTEIVSSRYQELNLNELENLFVLRQVLHACQILLTLAGNYFMLNTGMISFSETGMVKVWYNENFGKHEINQSALLRNEQQMIRGIINIFENKLIKKYDFFQAVTFLQVSCSLENLLKAINKGSIQSQIQYKMKKKQLNQTSFKKLSMSDKSINGTKTRQFTNHRSSIQVSIEKFHTLSHIKILQSKQNQTDLRLTSSFISHPLKQSILKIKKKDSEIKVPMKISLSDACMNHQTPLVSNFPQNIQKSFVQKPIIRINYENNKMNENNQDSNMSYFTSFPQEKIEPTSCLTVKNPKKAVLLRPSYRRCSQIVQRSQQGENTESEVSEGLDNSNNDFGAEFHQLFQNQNFQFSNPFELNDASFQLQM